MFDDEMLTIEDLASYLKLKPQTIYKWAQSGKIPGAKFGKEWRFRRSHIEDWIDDRMAQHGAPAGPKRTSSSEPPKEPDVAKGSGSSAKPDPSSFAAEGEDEVHARGVASDGVTPGEGVAGDSVAPDGAEPGKRAKRRRPGADFN